MTHPTPRRARTGVSVLFFTNGVMVTALLPRYPEIKDAFDLDNAQFGLLVVALAAGGLVAAPVSGIAVRRFGALRVTSLGTLALGAALTVAGFTPSLVLFAGAMVAAGAVDALIDSAQNIQGVLVEQWRGRSVMNSLHALWSVGAATGGAIGAGAAAAGVDLGVQMAVNGAVWTVVAIGASRLATVPVAGSVATEDAVGSGADAQPVPPLPRPPARIVLLPLIALAIASVLAEDFASNWAVLFMRQETSAPSAIAGLALTVALGAQFVGRLLGDPLTDRWGGGAVTRTGGTLMVAGAVVVATSPHYALALVGFALLGLGCAPLVPAAFSGAGRVPWLREGTGIAIISWLMRIAFLVTSPAIGVVSNATDLRVAMALPLAAGAAAVLLAGRAQPSGRPRV